MAYNENEARALVIRAGHLLTERGLIARTWGNISARISDSEFIITPSGLAYDTLRPEQLVRVSIADCAWEGDVKPSSEKGIHAAAYRLRPEASFVIHTHQDAASVAGITGRTLSTGEHCELLGGRVPCARYGLPSTKPLSRAVEEAIAQNPCSNAVLMRYHGTLCIGRDFENAFAVAEALEELCETAIGLMPIEPAPPMPTELLEAARGLYAVADGSPAAAAVSRRGKTLRPFMDDLAQIAGVNVRCAEPTAESVAKQIRGRNAVLVRGFGAVCTGKTPEDAEAVRMILTKSCRASLYADTVPGCRPLRGPDCAVQRLIYLKKYSRQKQ